jgi:hypothetical protein
MSTLDESFEAIMDSVIRKLEAEQAPGKTLSGVKKIIRGDRSEPTPYTPCIWVFRRDCNSRRQLHYAARALDATDCSRICNQQL